MRFIYSIGLFAVSCAAFSQNNILNDTISLNRRQAETIFLEKNLLLVSEALNIPIAEAQAAQAKLWPNPTLEVSEVNLWANAKSEQLPPLWGNFGRTSEIVVSVEQLILTAGKRKKMVAMEKVATEMAQQYFEDFLRNIKIEFRNNLTELQYVQLQEAVYKKQVGSMQKLLNAYSNQAGEGNISKGEYLRLKASQLEFLKELADLQKDNNRLQKELKTLMSLPAASYIKISTDGFVPDITRISTMSLADMTAMALENRPDVKAVKLEDLYNKNKYRYERALRTPDVTLNASYDRGGNIMNDFVGFGFSLDIPFFNRNQGNIKAAKIATQQSAVLVDEKLQRTQAEIMQSYSDLNTVAELYRSIDADYENDLDNLLESHLRNFAQRNTGILEYLDYVEAYLENKKIILNSKKDLNEQFEELQFVIGQELK